MAGWLSPRKLHPCISPILSLRQEAQLPERQLKIESKNKRLSLVWRGAQLGRGGSGPWGASAGCKGKNQAPRSSTHLSSRDRDLLKVS